MTTSVLTRYYRMRYRDLATWGQGAEVHGRLRLRGPGRIVIGDSCVFEDTAGPNAVHVVEPQASVDIGDRCRLSGLDVSASGDVTIGAEVRVRGLRLDGPGRIIIGDGCEFDQGSGGNAIHAVHPWVTVRIGDGCYLNGLDVFATEDTTLGERCIVGKCSMMTTDFHSTRRDRWSPDAEVKRGPITVGTNVWIAGNTIVTKNVSIGDNSVVSIGTIVREDVPANVIVSSHEQRVVKGLTDC